MAGGASASARLSARPSLAPRSPSPCGQISASRPTRSAAPRLAGGGGGLLARAPRERLRPLHPGREGGRRGGGRSGARALVAGATVPLGEKPLLSRATTAVTDRRWGLVPQLR